jgi:hypothetical protein
MASWGDWLCVELVKVGDVVGANSGNGLDGASKQDNGPLVIVVHRRL